MHNGKQQQEEAAEEASKVNQQLKAKAKRLTQIFWHLFFLLFLLFLSLSLGVPPPPRRMDRVTKKQHERYNKKVFPWKFNAESF